MHTPLPLLALIALTSPVQAQLPKVRDSAGVHIVENPARAKGSITFKLSDKPTHDVGGLKDNLDDELSTNTGALTEIRLSDGRYVVADETRLRFLDATGKQERVVGRRGQGPGEFQYIRTLCRTGADTIVVADDGNSRVTVFDKTGAMVREVSVGRTSMPESGCFEDGTFLVIETLRPAGAPATTRLIHRQLDGTVLGTAGEFWGGILQQFNMVRPQFAVRGQQVYFGDPRVSEVRRYNPQGTLIGIIRTADPIERTTASERAAMRPAYSIATNDQALRDRAQEQLRTAPRPEEWPSYARMLVDPDGRLWLQDVQKDRLAPTPLVWTVFDATGRLLGRFPIPPPLKRGDPRIIAFTSGGVLIGRNDDDGAYHLTTYALVPVKGAKP